MSKYKHTPGPWKFVKSEYMDNCIYDVNGDLILSSAPGDATTCDISDADARLIAAGPDLLATCKWVLACLDNMQKSHDNTSARRELKLIIDKVEEK